MILSKAYNEIMETIHMSEESHERILSNIIRECEESKPDKISSCQKKRYLAVAAAALVCVIAVPVIYHSQNMSVDREDNTTIGADDSVQMANGIVECTSAEELSEKVGFPVYDLKKEILPFKADTIEYYSYWEELAEIEYTGNDGNYAVYRKAEGNEDPSGDYNEYAVQEMISLNDMQITLKGDKKSYNLAVWTYENYSYSLYLSEGISENLFQDILKEIFKTIIY